MYKCKHFCIEELVSPYWFNRYGERCWEFLNQDALRMIDLIKESVSPDYPVKINTYKWGGAYTQSGLRDVEHYGSYEKYHNSMSGHKLGTAFDLKFATPLDEVFEKVVKLVEECPDKLPNLRVEDIAYTRGKYNDWLHIQISNLGEPNKVTVFKP